MRAVPLGRVVKIDRAVASRDECASLPYVGLEHIEKDTGRFSTSFERKPEALLATKFRFTAKHVLYGKLRPYLNKAALPSFAGVCTTEILPLLPAEDKLDRVYLWAFLLTPEFVEWATSKVSGANLPRLSPKLLAEYEIPLPSLPEQQRVAAVLERADRLRRLRRAGRELSDSYLQSAFVEVFGDPETNSRNWDCDSLDRVILDTQNGTGQREPVSSDGTIVLRIKDVGSGFIDYSDPRKISLAPAEARHYRLEDEDLLLVRVNGNPGLVGRAAIFRSMGEAVAFSDHIIRVKLRRDLADPMYVVHLLNSPYGRKQMLGSVSTTAGQFTVNRAGLSRVSIPYPPRPLQTRFANIAQCSERLRAQQREGERQAEHLFQTLLHRAFRGEL